MDIWIIRDGEKIGPIHDFEVRRKIENGDLTSDTPAWHEGLGAWKPLVEIDLFTREFELAVAPHESAPEAEEEFIPPIRSTPPPLPAQTYYGRRFWARWFDLMLYSGIWWLAMWGFRQDIKGVLLNPWIMFLQYVPWFALEALLLHYIGTTPGKWLLGLHVVNKDGSRLTLSQSIHRAMRVIFTGIGFGWGPLAVFCQVLSIVTAKRIGTTLWDHTGGHRVEASPLNPFRTIALVFLFFGALKLQMLVLPPVASPELLDRIEQWLPGFKKEYEKNPQWHLPDRSRKQEKP